MKKPTTAPSVGQNYAKRLGLAESQPKPERVAPHKSHPGKNLGKHLGKGFKGR